jgi:hypothetical protein
MIQFMDYSFERAFEKKEKDFMIAYRVIPFIAMMCLFMYIGSY